MQRHRQDQLRRMRLRGDSLKGDARAQNFEAIKAHILARRPRTGLLQVQDLHLHRCAGLRHRQGSILGLDAMGKELSSTFE